MSENQENLPVIAEAERLPMDILSSPAAFEHLQRVATMFSKSKLVPAVYQNNLADAAIVTHMAHILNVPVLFFMQRAYPVKGKLGLEAQLYISLVNRSGLYKGGVKYIGPDGEGLKRGCVAYGIRADDGEREEGARVTMQMAKDEGWDSNSKWKSMPDHMLKLRAASFLVKEHHPELTHGMVSVEELIDIDARTTVIRDAKPRSPLTDILSDPPADVQTDEDGQVIIG